MKYIHMLFDNKINIYLFLISPIIDVLTGLMTLNGYSITIGVAIRLVQLFFAVGYILLCDKKNNKKNYIYLSILVILLGLNIFNNIDIIRTHGVSYLGYIFKYNYFAIVILYFYRYLYKNPNINLRILYIPIIIFTAFILISNLTDTAFLTYPPPKMGNSSWYFSGNEYSSNLCILLPIVLYIFLDRVKPNAINIAIFMIFIYGAISCGTKASAISLFGCLVFYILYRIIKIKKEKINFQFALCLFILFSVIIGYKKLPTYINMSIHLSNIDETISDSSKINKMFLSDRDLFLKRIEGYDRNVLDNLIGKSYIYNGYVDIIESDIFDVYYMYGIVGFASIYGLFFFLIFKQLVFLFKNFRKTFWDSKYCLALISIGLTILTSLIAGHTISSPSVAVFAAFILAKISVFKDVRCNGKIVLYAYEYDNQVKKLIDSKKFDNVVIAKYIKTIPDKCNIEVIMKNRKPFIGYLYVLKQVFIYFTGKIKYSKSYMVYNKNKNHYFAKLCYISSMESVLLITENNYNNLNKIEKYKAKNDNFQRIKEIKE